MATETCTPYGSSRRWPTSAGPAEAGLLLLALLIDESWSTEPPRRTYARALAIHATHHSDEAMTWLTLFRKHRSAPPRPRRRCDPADPSRIPAWAVVASTLIRTWWGYFIHATAVDSGPGRQGVLSPAAHRLHHIRDERLMGQNFGGFFTLWDRLFGTFDDASGHLRCRTGIAGGSRPLLGELARPLEALLPGKRGSAAPAA